MPLTPTSTRTGTDGKDYTVSYFVDQNGCLLAEQWVIDGLFHAYSGGGTQPKKGTSPPTRTLRTCGQPPTNSSWTRPTLTVHQAALGPRLAVGDPPPQPLGGATCDTAPAHPDA